MSVQFIKPKNPRIKELKNLLKFYGVRYRFIPGQRDSFAYSNRGIVVIGMKGKSEDMLISVVFHELAHVMLYLEGKFMTYHDLSKPLTPKLARKIVRTAVRAERFADKRAREEMVKYYPNLNYIPVYETASSVEYYRKKQLDYLKKFYS